MARPKLSDQKVRKKWISVRVNETEHEQISNKAMNLSLSSADYLRRLGLQKKIKEVTPLVDRDTYRQISGIANNINQIVIKINSGTISEIKSYHFDNLKKQVGEIAKKVLK